MSFETINEERKQHLSLSAHANAVIEHDMCSFNIQQKSTFINCIFENYYPDAEASLSISSANFREKLKKQLETSNINCDDQKVNDIINTQVANFVSQKLAFYSNFPKQCAFKLKVNKENYEYLFQHCQEDRYYKSSGSFMKAVIEEYCQKSFLEREIIYAKKKFEIIKEAIRCEKKLFLQSATGEKLYLKPYRIIPDPLSMYHYIVGYEVRQKDDGGTESFSYSCRISNLKHLEMRQEKSFISKGNKKFLEEEIRKKGVQFMIGDVCEVKVYLTDEGINLYNRMWHLRPQYKEISSDGHIYSFLCSPNQIHYYFFKFGKEAVVLFPEELRAKMITMHEASIESYKKIK